MLESNSTIQRSKSKNGVKGHIRANHSSILIIHCISAAS